MDPDSAEPMYRQLAAILRQRIKTGEIGTWLPSKLSLSQEHGVSRATVDEAFRVLREEGLIVTVPGKAMRAVRPGDAPARLSRRNLGALVRSCAHSPPHQRAPIRTRQGRQP